MSKKSVKIKWFKVLTPEGRELEQELRTWPLPCGTKSGEWFISASRIGTLLVQDPSAFILKANRVFVAEQTEERPIIELPGLVWVRKAKLIREATNLDLKPFQIHRATKQIV